MSGFYDGGMGEFGMEGLYDSLAGIKETAIEYGILAGGVLVGAALAKLAVSKLEGLMVAGSTLGFLAPYAKYVLPLIPVAIGVVGIDQLNKRGLVQNDKARDFAKGVAGGMIAYGVGDLLFGNVTALAPYAPFAGIGGYGFAGYLGSAAPTTVENEGMGAPMSVEQVGGGIGGAPVTVEEELAGVAATFGG